ncbi:uncharacterized protein LOC132456244 [Gadus macrocephalus]|uniref:uncharacterized protein LOC132456244 n=1 Tax=Gadus macrocephalus TaxID=80720 RepID=UPI0028CB6605|nr:uncharacterized protein LOC132456244 [Gadus macrocephalus]
MEAGKPYLRKTFVMILLCIFKHIYLKHVFQQTVGYFFSPSSMPADDIATVIKDAIRHLHHIGLTVQAVICDQGSPNVKAVRNLGASLDPLGGEESHCILVGVQRVPVIFDVPHLLKSIRNNLFKHALQTQGKTVLWKHISQFYELDKLHTIRMAPKLTDKHILLPAFSKMRASLAARVFSHTVFAGKFFHLLKNFSSITNSTL